MKEKTVDPGRPSIRYDIRSSLLTLSPDGPWFYAILTLAQAGGVALVTHVLPLPFDLTLATLFATEGIVCMVVAWILAGDEGHIRGGLRLTYGQVPVEGGPDLPPRLVEVQHDVRTGAPNVPIVFLLTAYGVLLLVVAFMLAV